MGVNKKANTTGNYSRVQKLSPLAVKRLEQCRSKFRTDTSAQRLYWGGMKGIPQIIQGDPKKTGPNSNYSKYTGPVFLGSPCTYATICGRNAIAVGHSLPPKRSFGDLSGINFSR